MNRDYSKFDIEDFAFDETFQKWVMGETSPQNSFWEGYLTTYPEQTDKVLAARGLVLALRNGEFQNPNTGMMQDVWQNVQERIQPKRTPWWQSFSTWKVAASFAVLLVSLGVWFLLSPHGLSNQNPRYATVEENPSGLIEEINRTNKIINIHLSDGSIVRLSQNSRLKYPKNFDSNERIVQLSGEAFFEVQKNPDQPFLIYANETVTKVLGTSFRISAFQNAPKVIVSVATGKVSVFAKKVFEESRENKTPPGIILTANQRAEFTRDQEQFNKTLVEKPGILKNSQNTVFDFDNEPLKKVFAVLETAYGVDIIYDPDLVTNRSLTVSLGDETLYEKLAVICNTMGMRYQIVDAKIIIEKKK